MSNLESDGVFDAESTAVSRSTKAVCSLCPHNCHIAQGHRGVCGTRTVRAGVVVPEQYGRISSLALDPIEKKPLAFFHPGSMILSLGSWGCNLDCPFCQNSSIAHGWVDETRNSVARAVTGAGGVTGGRSGLSHVTCDKPDRPPVTPPAPVTPPVKSEESPIIKELVSRALLERKRGNIGLAYTYNEPLINFEFVRDCARRIHEAGMLNVAVTNGYLNDEPWSELLGLLDAANIDLKGFTQDFYDLVRAPSGLATVKRNIASAAARIHVEVTTLVIPGLNDSPEEIEALAAWLASIDRDIPLHLTRFFPQHRMRDRAPTPVATLRRAAELARLHLNRVLIGNV
ncbi:MAG: radical SAM protein [Coriobacteriia bacterium]|nr:radical SAM protein [Coriobacteriia bacterium]